MKKLYIVLFLNCILLSEAQESIQTDRPDQTESVSITPRNHIQIETGLLFEKQDRDAERFLHPTILWKFGLNDNVEIRLETEFLTQKEGAKNSTGLAPLTFGFKAKLVEEQKFIPNISFLGNLKTNKLGSKNFQTSYLAPAFRFLFDHTLSDKLNLGYNLGAEWDGESPAAKGIYTLAAGYSFTEKLSGFAEVYGLINKYTKADHRFDTGFTYLLNNNFMLDTSVGFGLSKVSPEYFLSCGFSYRFPLK